MEFREIVLFFIENGIIVNIGWLLCNGLYVDFNIIIIFIGDNRVINFFNFKVFLVIFFVIYKMNLMIFGLYLVLIIVINKVNSLKISGNLSV